MKNIYDIRKAKTLQFIFPTNQSAFPFPNEELKKIAVVVHLYYTEKVEFYSTYLNQLPEEITLYIFSSKDETIAEAQKHVRHNKTLYLKKENRGRDLSAFLVAFRPYLAPYDLLCFIHDKKERAPWEKTDADKWNENLWGNMIATAPYIYNVLHLLEQHPELGMLFPPEPIGDYRTAWFSASWEENYDNCLELAKKMRLSADIRKTKPPIALGSVFWARKEVLSKLFDMNWEYEDFPAEPMPRDFTISHAIERIFGYLAQDAGYDAATIMTEQYASWSLLFLQDHFRKLFFEVSDRIGMDTLRSFDVLCVKKERILDYVKTHMTVYLYGAGKYGKALLKLLREEGVEPSGFTVTKKSEGQEFLDGLKVYEIIDPVMRNPGVGVVLTVFYPQQKEMLEELEKNGIHDFIILFDEWFRDRGEKH